MVRTHILWFHPCSCFSIAFFISIFPHHIITKAVRHETRVKSNRKRSFNCRWRNDTRETLTKHIVRTVGGLGNKNMVSEFAATDQPWIPFVRGQSSRPSSSVLCRVDPDVSVSLQSRKRSRSVDIYRTDTHARVHSVDEFLAISWLCSEVERRWKPNSSHTRPSANSDAADDGSNGKSDSRKGLTRGLVPLVTDPQ